MEPLSYEAWAEDEADYRADETTLSPVVVDDLRPGETVADRNARILARNAEAREAERPTGHATEIWPQTIRVPFVRGAQCAPLRGQVLRDLGSNGGRGRPLRNDPGAIRSVFAAAAASGSYSLEDLIRPTPRGRLRTDEQQRRDQLARAVVEARDAGANVQAIGRAIGRPISTVNALEARGRALVS